jgi:hypothetical protein
MGNMLMETLFLSKHVPSLPSEYVEGFAIEF